MRVQGVSLVMRRVKIGMSVRRCGWQTLSRSFSFRPLLRTLAVALVAAGLLGTGFRYAPVPLEGGEWEAPPDGAFTAGTPADRQLLYERSLFLAKQRKAASPGRYVVIDRTHNRLYVREGSRVLLEALCSCGSGIVFSQSERRWEFETPRGCFRVDRKLPNPVWRKPDWAFLEEGRPVPSDPSERFDYEALGEYALCFGTGYMIHGTLYERLLGRNVTHGCIRLGREDLRTLWRSVEEGTPIYVF